MYEVLCQQVVAHHGEGDGLPHFDLFVHLHQGTLWGAVFREAGGRNRIRTPSRGESLPNEIILAVSCREVLLSWESPAWETKGPDWPLLGRSYRRTRLTTITCVSQS